MSRFIAVGGDGRNAGPLKPLASNLGGGQQASGLPQIPAEQDHA
jgi:hypothetical protein